MNNYISAFIYLLFSMGGGLLLNAQSSAPQSPNSTLEAIAQSDSVVEGTFIVNPSATGVSSSLQSPLRQTIQGATFAVPFQITQAIKGNSSGTITVNLFYPAIPMGSSSRCLLPIRQNLLLFLKKNASGTAFDLVDPWATWLVIPKSSDNGSSSTPPETAVFEKAKSYLKYRLANPQEAIQYPSTLGANAPYEVLNPDPNILRAFQIGRDISPGDPDFVALLKQYSTDPGQVGHAARTILLISGNIQDSLQRLADHDDKKGSGGHNLEIEIEEGLRNSNNLDVMKPLISKALASPDPQIRLCTLRGLTWNQKKDTSLYPQLVTLLDDPDQEVQHAAMSCIFYMSGEIKHNVAAREINLPAVKIFEKNPSPWLQMYKTWWEKHKSSFQ